MSKSKTLTAKDLAKRWNVHEGTIKNWRWQNKGPKYYKIGEGIKARVIYKLKDVIAYEKKFNLAI